MTHDRVQLAGPDLVLQWTPSRAWPPVPAPARELITQREESTEGCDHILSTVLGAVCCQRFPYVYTGTIVLKRIKTTESETEGNETHDSFY